MREKLDKIYIKFVNLLGSSWILVVVISLFVLQALWLAFSFRYPMIYDEYFHFGIIKTYTEHWWPVIYNQPESYDVYRDFAGEGSKLFHFLMSFPQRSFEVFTSEESVQVLLHRIMNIAMVTTGMYYFVRLFDRLKIKRVYSNVALLLFTLLPMPIFVAATINYDNAVFMLTPVFMLFFVKAYQSRGIEVYSIVAFFVIGLAASLIKFTFLPVFAALTLALLVIILQRHNKNIWQMFIESLGKLKSIKGYILVAGFVMLSFLFAQTYLVNVINYGTPRPTCQQTLGVDRCLANGIIKRNERLLDSKQTRGVEDRSDFSISWTKMFLNTSFLTGASTADNQVAMALSPSLFKAIFWFSSVAAILIIIYAWRAMRLSAELKIIAGTGLFYLGLIFIQSMSIYYMYHQAVAIQSRYLLIFVPIVIVLAVMASAFITRRFKLLRIPLLVVILLLFTQGGGLTTHILRSNDSWYWQNPKVIDVNQSAKNVLHPIVDED